MKFLSIGTELLITTYAKNLVGLIIEEKGTFITFKEDVEVIKKSNGEIETHKLRKIAVGDDVHNKAVSDNLNQILNSVNNIKIIKTDFQKVDNPMKRKFDEMKSKYDEMKSKLEMGQTLDVSKICSIKLADTYLSIARPNTFEFRSHSCEGENRIYYRNIVGFRKESYGYIRVLVAGVNNEKSGGMMNLKLLYDPFSIHLSPELSGDDFRELLLSIINKKMSTKNQEAAKNTLSKYDEIKKAKELYDLGILSLEEYNIEKEKLLK